MPTFRLLTLFLVVFVLSAQAEVPPTVFTSRSQAEHWRNWAIVQNAAIEARYAHDEWACYDKFFVNYCVDHVRDVRRTAKVTVDPIIISANRFLRKLDYQEHLKMLDKKNQSQDSQIKERQNNKK